MPTDDELLAAAFAYGRDGFAIIPLWSLDDHGRCKCRRPGCEHPGKHPMLKAWQDNYCRTGEEIAEVWMERHPGANIGICTGREHGLWLLDIDADKGGMESWAKFQAIHDPLWTPEGVRVHTTGGGGLHLWFGWPPGAGEKAIRNGAGVYGVGTDARGWHGFGVAPPSASHKGGYGVRVAVPAHDSRLAPEWISGPLLALADRPVGEGAAGTIRRVHVDLGALGGKLLSLATEIPETGDRSTHFFRLGAEARRAGLGKGELIDLIARLNDECHKHATWDALESDVHGIWARLDREEAALSIRVPAPPVLPFTLHQPPALDADGEPVRPLLVAGHGLNRVDLFALMTGEKREPDWLVPQFMEAGGNYLLASGAKTGKSLLCLDLACRLASGHAVWNGEQREPITVGYADMENGEGLMQDRLYGLGYKPEELDPHLALYLYPPITSLDTARDGAEFVKWVMADGVGLVIIDTIGKFTEGKQSDAETTNNLYRHTILPLKRLGITVLRLDHFGKDAGKGPMGSAQKTADVDAVWELNKRNDRSLILKCTHDRSGSLAPKIEVTRSKEPTSHVLHPLEAWPEEEQDEDGPGYDDEIVALMDAEELPAGMSIRAMKEWGKARELGRFGTGFGERVAMRLQKRRVRAENQAEKP